MAKRTDLKKILIIGSGPIVIGQAAEFDYAGTQACLALKEEGYEVVLVNSNPATIMTDTTIADKVYMEPLTLEYIAKILRYERPDAIIPGLGGQTGLNLAMQLAKKGVLDECQVKLLGTNAKSIERAEDRELFKEMCESIGQPVIQSEITYSIEEAKVAAERIGYPVVLRPAFTLGGTGGGFAYNEEELVEIGIMRDSVAEIDTDRTVDRRCFGIVFLHHCLHSFQAFGERHIFRKIDLGALCQTGNALLREVLSTAAQIA